jgi:hypothetical protein
MQKECSLRKSYFWEVSTIQEITSHFVDSKLYYSEWIDVIACSSKSTSILSFTTPNLPRYFLPSVWKDNIKMNVRVWNDNVNGDCGLGLGSVSYQSDNECSAERQEIRDLLGDCQLLTKHRSLWCILMKFNIWDFFKNISRKIKFY